MLYLAEYLERIKSVAVSIHLPEGCQVKKLDFVDQRVGKVRYKDAQGKDQEEELVLPEDIKPAIAAQGYSLEVQTNTVSFRLPANPDLNQKPVSSFFDNPKVKVPWSASQMDSSTRILCAGCSNTLIRPGQVKTFKPLPSENWHEMMDFWHCHKPSEKDDNHNYNPAYAISKFSPGLGHCLVGLSYFLINKNEIGGQTSCKQCKRPLAQAEMDGETMRLWKWNTRLETEREDTAEWYPYYIYVSANICELIESHAIYTFAVKSDDQVLLLWIFNPHIRFTTTNCKTTCNGFKVFYSTDKTKIPKLEQTRGDVEEVGIPRNVYNSLLERLEKSTHAFPENARKSGDWNAGILDKL